MGIRLSELGNPNVACFQHRGRVVVLLLYDLYLMGDHRRFDFSLIGFKPNPIIVCSIVLEPVGSARLTFNDDLYHDLCVLVTEDCSESRNGRGVKIDILDNSIWTPEWFQDISDIYQSTEGLPEPPGEVMGQHGP